MKKRIPFMLLPVLMVPALAMAAPPGVGTYAYEEQFTYSAPKLNQSPIAANFNLAAYLARLAAHFSKADRDCPGVPTANVPSAKAAATTLMKATYNAGDTGWTDGVVTFDSSGRISNSFSTSNAFTSVTDPTKTTATFNVDNKASHNVICGGAASGSGPGSCSVLCTSSNLKNVKGNATIPGTACLANGGQAPFPPDPTTGNYRTSFIFPVCGAFCDATHPTFAEACNDPALVLIGTIHQTFYDGGDRIHGTITEQGVTGVEDATRVP